MTHEAIDLPLFIMIWRREHLATDLRGCMEGGVWKRVHGRGCMEGGLEGGVWNGLPERGVWKGVHEKGCMEGGFPSWRNTCLMSGFNSDAFSGEFSK